MSLLKNIFKTNTQKFVAKSALDSNYWAGNTKNSSKNPFSWAKKGDSEKIAELMLSLLPKVNEKSEVDLGQKNEDILSNKPDEEVISKFHDAVLSQVKHNQLDWVAQTSNLALTTSLSKEGALVDLSLDLSQAWTGKFITIVNLHAAQFGCSIHVAVKTLLKKDEILLYATSISIDTNGDQEETLSPTVILKYLDKEAIAGVVEKEFPKFINKQIEQLCYQLAP